MGAAGAVGADGGVADVDFGGAGGQVVGGRIVGVGKVGVAGVEETGDAGEDGVELVEEGGGMVGLSFDRAAGLISQVGVAADDAGVDAGDEGGGEVLAPVALDAAVGHAVTFCDDP